MFWERRFSLIRCKFEQPYLYLKSRYINEEFPHYAEQLAMRGNARPSKSSNFINVSLPETTWILRKTCLITPNI